MNRTEKIGGGVFLVVAAGWTIGCWVQGPPPHHHESTSPVTVEVSPDGHEHLVMRVPESTPVAVTTTEDPATPPVDVRHAVCDALGIPNIDRGPYGNPCPAG